jgi:protein-glutamine gamma-glutamyltransferase
MTYPVEAPAEHWRRNRLAVRLAAVALGAVGLVLLASRSVGSSFEPSLMLGVAAPLILCAVFVNRRWWVRLIAQLIGLVAVCVGVAVLADGRWQDGFAGLTDGAGQMLSTQWPTPRWPTVMVVLAAVTAVVAGLAAETSIHRRWRALPALPLVLGFVGFLALSSPDGPQWSAFVAVLVAVFILLLIGDARQAIAPTRLLLTLAVLSAATVAVATTVAFTGRADPRSSRSPDRQLDLVDLLAQSAAEGRLATPSELYSIRSSGLADSSLWRSAALDVYNGEVWSSSGELLPAGTAFAPDGPLRNATVSVTVFEAAPAILPVPGTVIRSEQVLEADQDRHIVRLVDQTRPATVDLTVEPSGPLSPDDQIAVASGSPSDIENSFAAFAAGLVPTATTVTERVRGIAAKLTTTYQLNSGPSGPGTQQGLVDKFLRKTKQGTREQFLTGFVLLARSVGAEARVATGYEVTLTNGVGSISTSDARSWAEVLTTDGVWRRIDVVPTTAEPITDVPVEDGGGQAGLPDQPPPAAEAESSDEPADSSDETAVTPDSTVEDAVRILTRVGAVAGLVILLPLLLVALTIVLIKRRRRAGLRSGDPARRVVTAWTLASDALVDAGAELRHSTTNAEVVTIGTQMRPRAESSLRSLQVHADASVFSAVAVDPDTAQRALTELHEIEAAITKSSTLRWRARWWLSTRSLRRSTRSPLRNR